VRDALRRQNGRWSALRIFNQDTARTEAAEAQEVFPRSMMSPAMLSPAKSSSTVPTKCLGMRHDGRANFGNPPPLVMAAKTAARRPRMMPFTRSNGGTRVRRERWRCTRRAWRQCHSNQASQIR